MANVIMRVAWNRPEMLQVSIDHEIKAREYHMLDGDFLTLFVVEHGTTQEVVDVINNYPYKKKVLMRKSKQGLTPNILKGMKTAFDLTDDYICYIEDDICVHYTYFKYLDVIMNMDVGKYSVISAYNKNDNGHENEIYRGHHYCAWGALITRHFFEEYIQEHAHEGYFGTSAEEMKNYHVRDLYVKSLNEAYIGHKNYKYKNGMHNEQAGMINRLVDIALIEEDMCVVMPRVNRQMHIGFYGKNRPSSKSIPGNTFEGKVKNLYDIIKSVDKMYNTAQAKQYRDYAVFDKRLDEWGGTLYVE